MTIKETGDRIVPLKMNQSEEHGGIFFRKIRYEDGELNHLGGLNTTDIQVLKSAAGFYIGWLEQDNWGTAEEPNIQWSPAARDSQQYWPTREDAEVALMTGNYQVKF